METTLGVEMVGFQFWPDTAKSSRYQAIVGLLREKTLWQNDSLQICSAPGQNYLEA